MKQNSNTPNLVDVRNPEEFFAGHVEGAVNIPLDLIPQNISRFKNMVKPIILYCRSGNRSGIALNYLKQQGIAEIVNGGGIDEVKSTLRTLQEEKTK